MAEVNTAFDAALAEARQRLAEKYDEAAVDLLTERAVLQITRAFWTQRLERYLNGLEGEAAVTLAEAQARRWELEMRAAGEVALLENERYAFAVAPEIYKTREYLQVLVNGLMDARKYFVAFDPGDKREVHVRLQTEEQAQPDILDTPMNLEQ